MYSYIGHHYVQVFYIYSENKGLYIYVVMPGDECLKHGSPHEDLLIHSQTNTRQKHPYKPASSVWLRCERSAPKQHLAQHKGGVMLLHTDFGSDNSTMDMMKVFKN